MKISATAGVAAGRERVGLANLAGLVATSLATVAVLLIALSGPEPAEVLSVGAHDLLTIGILAGVGVFLIVAAIAFSRGSVALRGMAANQSHDVARLQRRLAEAEALLQSEAGMLVVWRSGAPADVVAARLPAATGVPREPARFLEFSQWLRDPSGRELTARVKGLLREGRSFRLRAETAAGALIDVEGATASGRSFLRLRDLPPPVAPVSLSPLAPAANTSFDLSVTAAILEALSMPAWVKSADGRLQFVNAAYKRLLPLARRNEALSRQIELLDAQQRLAAEQSLGSGEVYKARLPVSVGGLQKTFDVVASTRSGATIYVATETEASRPDDALRTDAVVHGRTLDRVSAAIAFFAPDQRLMSLNDACRKLWQLDADWLRSRPKTGEILDRLREKGQLPLEANYKTWKERQLACYGSEKEIDEHWYLPDSRTLHVFAERRADGGVTFLFEDVSEKLALESRYNALIGVQRETLDNLSEGVAVFATDGRLRLHNPAFARIWRLSPQELARGPHIDEVVKRCRVLHDNDRTWAKLKRAVTAMTDERQPIDGQMDRPDGSSIAFTGVPLPDGATLLTFMDISDSKQIERVLTERNDALVAADHLKSQFISHVSYELRTPLQNIIGFSELLERPHIGELNRKQHEYLGDISASSRTLLALIDDVLDLATIDAGALELKLEPVDVRALVEAAVSGIRERAARAKINVRIDIQPGVGSFVADGPRVKQVLYNLLSNAVGFSEPGGMVRLAVELGRGMLVFSVADHGVGIPADQQQKVFERFEARAQGSKHRGAGLGLAMVKGLVELHGGDVTLRSEPQKGTVFTVRLPEANDRASVRKTRRANLVQRGKSAA